MPDISYATRVSDTLDAIVEQLEAESACDDLDIDIVDAVLTIVFEDGAQVIINRQEPVQQLWVASPLGPAHFNFDGDRGVWVDAKTGMSLMETLSQAVVTAARMILTGNADLASAVTTSLSVSVTATALACAMGAPLGAWMAMRAFPGRPVAIVIVNALLGMPSVVVHTEETLEASARAVNRWLEVRAEDVWLRALPDFHVGGYQIGLRAALAGSRVAVDDAKWDAGGFAGICALEAVSLTSLVPAQLVDLVRQRLQAPACLRALVVGGGALDEGFRRDALHLGWPVLPSYGASEAGSQVATARPGKLGSLGAGMIVLPEWEARVSGGGNGGDGWPGDPGKAGVLELRGAALAVGRFIWQDGAWTRRKLADAQGWWRSSDRVFLNGRELEFEGRVDRVVKVLGELVNLEAVGRALEAAGLLHGGFAVIALPGERRGSEVVLVVETRLGDVGQAVQVYQEASAPFAMIMRVVQLAELPRTPLGKIRYAALAALIPPGVP